MNKLYLSIGFIIFLSYFIAVTNQQDVLPFGKPTKLKWFTLNPSTLYLNHGSYGAASIPSIEAQISYIRKLETNPLKFLSNDYRGFLRKNIARLASYVNAEEQDIVLIDNASSGINIVLQNLAYTAGDKVLVTSVVYNSVKTTLQYLKDKFGIEVVNVHIKLPTDGPKIIEAVREAFEQHKDRLKLSIFDEISSFPSLHLPVKELIQLSRSYGILSMIDGAHSIGQIPVNLKDLDPDFYFSNAHKWLCTPKSVAFMYVKRSLQQMVHPPVISHFYGQGYQKEFEWIGTRDYAAWLTIEAGLDFRETIGGEKKIFEYNNGLCRQVAQLMLQHWNTSMIVPWEMVNSLVTVPLPCKNIVDKDGGCTHDYDLEKIIQIMNERYDMWPLMAKFEGINYVRVACQIYNDFDEWKKFMTTFDEILASI